MAVEQSVIDKVKKLLDHYTGCLKIKSEQEALSALELAKKLMDKHHLSMSMIEDDATAEDSIVHVQCDKFSVFSIPIWVCNLIKIVNSICNACTCILEKDTQPNGYIHVRVLFVSHKNDIQNVEAIYQFFKKTTRLLANDHVKMINGNTTHWRSFAEGFTNRLLQRCKELNKTDEKTNFEIDESDIDDEDEELCDNWYDIQELDTKPESDTKDVVLCDAERNLEKYIQNVKIKIEEYIDTTFHPKQEKLKTKTKVLLDSYNVGVHMANIQKFPDMCEFGNANEKETSNDDD